MPRKLKVIRKQHNSKMCLVCGLKNPYGVKAGFFEVESNEVVARFTPCSEHQGYPGRLHGGIAAAVLDETIGRAIMIADTERFWGVTMELTVRFRRPVPLDQPLRAVGRITADNGRIFEGTGELLLPDGTAAVTAAGKYMKMRLERIADFDASQQEWLVAMSPEDPVELDLP